MFYIARARALDVGTRWAFATLFFGLVLTTLGSAYYHFDPNNQRLVFDRMPMIVVMAGCIGVAVADRLGTGKMWLITAALIAIGFWTVYYWITGEEAGHGDLRWYLLYQGMTFVVVVLLLFLFPSRYGMNLAFAWAGLGNVAAKIFEFSDRPIYALGGIVSGHTLKHLSAGLAFLPLAFLIRRIKKQQTIDNSVRPDLASAGSAR